MVYWDYELEAVVGEVQNPIRFVAAALPGPKPERPMGLEIVLDGRRSAVYVFAELVHDATTIAKDKA
ncbi:hypothetical protein OAP48_00295 [bacterium]|nr:hypothetical protein [bacterium]